MAKKAGNGGASGKGGSVVVSGEEERPVTEKERADKTRNGAADYQAESIQVLKGLEAVRRRPAMYIGTTGPRGLHHLVYEVVDNSVDEALAGFCTKIDVAIRKDQSIVVVDNGRGIPVDMHAEQKKPAVEVVMTVLHAGGKFDSETYKVSGGLHGVGVSVVNALSDWLEVEVSRDGHAWHQRYERGETKTALKKGAKTSATGTKVTFHPDPEVFEEIDFHFETLSHRLREIAYLTRGLTIDFADERSGRKETFHFEGGIAQFVAYLNETKDPIHAPPIYFLKSREGVEVDVAMQWNDTYVENIYSFANNINTIEGGSHLSGFKTALTRTLNNYATKNNLFKNDKFSLEGEDTREGVTAVISIRLAQPQFEGQTKTKLGNSEVRGVVESVVGESLSEFLEENPPVARKILDKCVTAARSREAARKAKELTRRKSALESGSLPGKLADCSFTDPEMCEIYIVEGESAGGCLAGETRVALASGGARMIAELARDWAQGVAHFGYATNEAGDIRIVRLGEPRLTKRSASLVEVVLDNGERIRCTPDHPFRMRDGSYRAASALMPGDSLMAMTAVDARAARAIEAMAVGAHSLGESRGPVVAIFDAPHTASLEVARVRVVAGTADVYDLTVDGYHNFALASGVFVHNSAKQGRDRRFQAVLPIKGKILNVEKARPDKMLSNEEIRTLIMAIGTGIGDEEFDLAKARYGKVIIMSVDSGERTFVRGPDGQVRSVRVGPFIDRLMEMEANPSEYEVLCFDPNTGAVRYKPIKSVIRHGHAEPLYEIETAYGRRIRVTGEHSVFTIDEGGQPRLTRGDEVRVGDQLAVPARLPHVGQAPERIDLLRGLVEIRESLLGDLMVRGRGVEELYKARVREEHAANAEMSEARVTIPRMVGEALKRQRQALGLSPDEICAAVGIRQPITYHHWERGVNRPTRTHFVRYVETLGLPIAALLEQVEVGDSRLEHVWKTQYRGAPANRVRTYVRAAELTRDDLAVLGDDVEITPRHYGSQGVPRHIPVNESLMFLLGFFVAEGSLSGRNGVRLAIGKRNEARVAELSEAIRKVFGLEPAYYGSADGHAHELRVLNSAVTATFRFLFGFDGTRAPRKHIPDVVFNVDATLQLAFLRGYFLGDGTLGGHGVSFATTSETLADQLMYLLLMHGVRVSVSEREPTGRPSGMIRGKPIVTRRTAYYLTVARRASVAALEPVWRDHARAPELRAWLASRPSNRGPHIARPAVGDVIGIPVRRVRRVEPSTRQVYDFSIEGDETFICGRGGVCCHNTDADVDGSHIRTLLLTFFFRHMRKLLEGGRMFIAQPPLYRLRKGKAEYYAFNDKEKERLLKELGKQGVSLQRYKGLGEMNPEQLWKTTMDPETRTILQVDIEDAAQADHIFSVLMGEKVEPRRIFIEENAASVKNLDV